MKVLLTVTLLVVPTLTFAKCRPGYKPTDVDGVCMAVDPALENPTWVSDEKPPEDKMPSWQREGITVVDAPNMAFADAKADQEKIDALAEGKRRARIK